MGLGIGIGIKLGGGVGASYPTENLDIIIYNTTYENGGTTYLKTSTDVGIPKVSGSGLDTIWDFSVLNDVRFNKSNAAYWGATLGDWFYNDTENPYHGKLKDYHYRELENQIESESNTIFAKLIYEDEVLQRVDRILVYESALTGNNLSKAQNFSRIFEYGNDYIYIGENEKALMLFLSGNFDFENNLLLDESINENNASIVQSACGTVKVTDLFILSSNLVGTLGDWQISNDGTAVAYIFASNQINFSQAGTIYNMRLVNSVLGKEHYYPICEKMIDRKAYDCSGNGNHLTIYYSSMDEFNANKQDDFHYNLQNGGSLTIPNILESGDFEDSFTDGLYDDLDTYGSPVTTEETSIIHSGTKAQRVSGNAGDGVYFTKRHNLLASEIIFTAWVYVISGSVRLVGYGSVRTNTPHYVATSKKTGEWEQIEVRTYMRANGTIYLRILALEDNTEFIVDDCNCKVIGETIAVPALESGTYDALGNELEIQPGNFKYVETSIKLPEIEDLINSDQHDFFFDNGTAKAAEMKMFQLSLENLVENNTIFSDQHDELIIYKKPILQSSELKRLLNRWSLPTYRFFKDYRSDFIYDYYSTINIWHVNRNYRVGIKENRYLCYSDDCGQTWSEIDYTGSTNFGSIVQHMYVTSKGSIIIIEYDEDFKKSSDKGVSFQNVSFLDKNGDALIKHTPINASYPGTYFIPYKRILDVYNEDSDTNVLAFGNWGNKLNGANPTYIYKSVDDGSTFQVFYEFGQNPKYKDDGTATGGTTGNLLGDYGNNIIARHVHEVSYNVYNNRYYVTVGDSTVNSEIHILEFDDSFTFLRDLTPNGTQRQRAVQLGFDPDGYMYYGSDGDPGSIEQSGINYDVWGYYKCKLDDANDLSKHELLLPANDIIVNSYMEGNVIILSISKQHNDVQDTNLYMSINYGKTFISADYLNYSYYIHPLLGDKHPSLITVDSYKNYLVNCGASSFYVNILGS